MPLWDNKALPTPNPNLNTREACNLLLFNFIFVENKCLSDVICDVKREKNECGKRRILIRVDQENRNKIAMRFNTYATGAVV